MPRLIVKQDIVTGGDADGSRDGRVHTIQDPASWTSDYETIADLRPGHYIVSGPGGVRSEYAHWLRFVIPLDFHEDITITSMFLKLWWNPQIDGVTIPGHGPALANEGLEDSGEFYGGQVDSPIQFRLRISNQNGSDAPIPSDSTNFKNLLAGSASINVATEYDHWIHHDPGAYPEPVVFGGEDLGQLFQDTCYDKPFYDPSHHHLFFIEPFAYLPTDNRYPVLRSWSWLKWRIGEGIFDASEIDTAPQLIIEYTQNTPGRSLGRHVEHLLVFKHSAEEHWLRLKKAVTDDLTVEQDITFAYVPLRDITDDIIFTQDITVARARDFNQDLEHPLFIEHEITVSKVHPQQDVEHDLTLEQTIEANTEFSKTVTHDLDITQEWTVGRAIDRELEHQLEFVHEWFLAGTKEKEAVSVMNIEQFFDHDQTVLLNPVQVEHTLSFEQWFGGGALTMFVDPKIPNKTVTRTIAPKRGQTPVTSGMHDLSGAASGDDEGLGHDIIHDPLPSRDDPSSCDRPDLVWSASGPLPDAPVLSETGSFILEYPPTTPTDTITLPPPVLGNKDELLPQRIQRKTRGGELITFRDENWNEAEVYRYQFEDLTDTIKQDFFAFLGTCLGQEIKITDHEGIERIGVITNPNGDAVNNYRNCGYAIEFHFQVSPQ